MAYIRANHECPAFSFALLVNMVPWRYCTCITNSSHSLVRTNQIERNYNILQLQLHLQLYAFVALEHDHWIRSQSLDTANNNACNASQKEMQLSIAPITNLLLFISTLLVTLHFSSHFSSFTSYSLPQASPAPNFAMSDSTRENTQRFPQDVTTPLTRDDENSAALVSAASQKLPPFSLLFAESPEHRLASLHDIYRSQVRSLAPHINRLAIILGYPKPSALPAAALALPKSPLVPGLHKLANALAPGDDVHAITLQLASMYALCASPALEAGSGGTMESRNVGDDVVHLLYVGVITVPTTATSSDLPGIFSTAFSFVVRFVQSIWCFLTGTPLEVTETELAIDRVQILIDWIRQVKIRITAEPRVGVEATERLLQRVPSIGPLGTVARGRLETINGGRRN